MARDRPWIPPHNFMNLSGEELALDILRHASSSSFPQIENYISDAMQHTPGGRGRRPQIEATIATAWNLLDQKGFWAPDPSQPSGVFRIITERGKSALREQTTVGQQDATKYLSQPLHPSNDQAVRRAFQDGDLDHAVFSAFREVEISVRDAGGFPNSKHGTDLMRAAFKADGGKLIGPNLDRGEQNGIADLYAGAIAVFKNPSSHRRVQYTNQAIAAKAIFLADLLLDMLDQTLADRKENS
jgi:uncharacterized protein (TIGR02391 family)